MAKIRFEDTDDIIDICQDNVFKAVFTKKRPESEERWLDFSLASSVGGCPSS